MTGEIIVGGVRHPCGVPVTAWHASTLGFPGLTMRESADLVCLCWSSTEEDAHAHHKNLRTRFDKHSGKTIGLSSHFFVDWRGGVWQYADALARVRFLPRGNDRRTIVVEGANRADPNRTVRGVTRELVTEVINGEASIRTTFTGPQMRSLLALTEALCTALAIPYAVPMEGNYVTANVLSEPVLAAHRGVIGRMHIDARRADPGLYVARAIAARSFRGKDGAAE